MAVVTHGHRVGGVKSPTYISWESMIARCTRPSHPFYAYYGGRGILVCDRWRGQGGFSRFLVDVGERPAGLTLDRIDVEGHYEPGNVKWSTPQEQRWNRRDMIAAALQYNDFTAAGLVTEINAAIPF